jgi:hypothetical protein
MPKAKSKGPSRPHGGLVRIKNYGTVQIRGSLKNLTGVRQGTKFRIKLKQIKQGSQILGKAIRQFEGATHTKVTKVRLKSPKIEIQLKHPGVKPPPKKG